MAIERLDFPAVGAVTDSWNPNANPLFENFIDEDDQHIAQQKSAGGKLFTQGSALLCNYFHRTYANVGETDRASLQNFRRTVGGNFFRYTDERGVPHRVKFEGYKASFQDQFRDNWGFSFTLREEMTVPPSLRKIATDLHRDLLFYAPLVANLGAFGRWDVTPTSSLNPLAFVANGVTFDGGDGLSFLEAGHILPAQGTLILACDVSTTSGGADAYQFVDAATLAGSTGLEIVSDANAVRARVFSGGAAVANLTGGAVFAANTLKKIGLAWAANDFRLVVDGAQVASDSSGAAPTALHGSSLFLGQRSDASRKLQGHLRDVAVFARALSNADIATIHAAL